MKAALSYLLLFTIICFLCLTHFIDVLLPHGPAHIIPRAVLLTKFSTVDYSNESFLNVKLSKIYENLPEGKQPLIRGPETPVVNPKTGKLYVLTEDGNLVRLNNSKQKVSPSSHTPIQNVDTTLVVNLGPGRPLGGKFTCDGKTLYIADTLLGLVRVRNVEKKKSQSKVEIVASSVVDKEGNESRILYANDVDIGPVTGHVYFTDSTDIAPERLNTYKWDTMTGYKRDYSRGKPTGRLLRYNPTTDEVDILATGIWFANGVAVMDKDESSLMISETPMARLLKYHLKGPKMGTMEVTVKKLPGYPDGVACSFEMGMCYAPMPSMAVPLFVKMANLPEKLNASIRTLLLMLPTRILNMIKPVRYGGVVEVQVQMGQDSPKGDEFTILQDPHAKEIHMLTGAATFKNKLFLGSLSNKFIGVVEFVN
jgi:sugar lactone lactonase YvrE